MDRLERGLVEEERAACAELARAIPCACKTLCIDHDWDGEFEGSLYYTKPGGPLGDSRTVDRHDSRCSQAVVAAIEARK